MKLVCLVGQPLGLYRKPECDLWNPRSKIGYLVFHSHYELNYDPNTQNARFSARRPNHALCAKTSQKVVIMNSIMHDT